MMAEDGPALAKLAPAGAFDLFPTRIWRVPLKPLAPHAPRSGLVSRRSARARHWVRANVRDAGGNLLLVGNPIYVND
ncbi:MAG TPA: hypothetical protein VMA74_09000 [Dyella sp.]|uniref:hypothetical protein n=1 Tax=Dyella sp. TaxID=1869338 RepID=UPI002B962021|nr:hypothetical protein [Dyella sp.]HUB89855.1 hypothetical protein [Dyella sp.]